MKDIFTTYSLSISFFIVFLIFWILEYFTLDYKFLSFNFGWLKYFALQFFGFVLIGTYLIYRGSPRTIEAHYKTQEKLDKILYYLEIDK